MEKTNTTANEPLNKTVDTFISDSKSLLNSSLNNAESGLEQAKESAINTFNEAKSKWRELEHAAILKGQEAGKTGRIYIYQNPFKSVLVASAAGLVIGFLLSVLRK